MANTSGLKPWPKGVSGNPSGRPKKVITDRLDKILAQLLPESEAKRLKLHQGATVGDAMVLAVIRQAKRGNVKAFKEITDRIEGKVTEHIEVSTPPEGLKIRVQFVKPKRRS